MELRKFLQILVLSVALTPAMLSSAAEVPSADREVVAQLKQAGSDLTKPHVIDYYLYFPSKSAATEAAERVKKLGLAIKRLDKAAVGTDGLVLASNRMVPSLQAIATIGSELAAIAKAGKGEYDGWQAVVTR